MSDNNRTCATCGLCHRYESREFGEDPYAELANKVLAATLRLGVGICTDEPSQPFCVDLDGPMPCGGDSWEPRLEDALLAALSAHSGQKA